MSFTQIFALVLQALTTRSVAFAFTVGTTHWSATITQTATPGSTQWIALFGIIAQLLAGQPGTFQIGVFQVVIQALQPIALSSATTTPAQAASAARV